jgi:predicted RNase H-like HicB family nuclease
MQRPWRTFFEVIRMKYRAIVKKSGEWWIGWLVDLPGVNAQEKTREGVLESLRIGAEDMLTTSVDFEPGAAMVTVEIPDPQWAAEVGG